jgi:hypothetical protein
MTLKTCAFGETILLLCTLTFLIAVLKENQPLTLYHLNGMKKTSSQLSNKEELLLSKQENYQVLPALEMLVLNTLEIGFWESKDGPVWLFQLMEVMEFLKDLYIHSLLLAAYF